jgi:4-hydroxybutyrate CoA-transferase
MFSKGISRFSGQKLQNSLHRRNIFVAVNRKKKPVVTNADDAVKLINSGDSVYIHMAAAMPQQLVNAMTRRHKELRNVKIYHMHVEGQAPYLDRQYAESFTVNCMFVGANARKSVQEGNSGYVPVFFSEVPLLFEKKIIPIDVALVQVSPPDKHGFCSMGVSVDCSVTAVNEASKVIAQINPNMPRTHGAGILHESAFDAVVHVNDPIFEKQAEQPTPVEDKIGEHIASLIENGATIQMGIGSIPDAVLKCLIDHKELGIHTEMVSDGIIDLVESGVITNQHKKIHTGKNVCGFAVGTKRLYNYLDDNPQFYFDFIQHINNPHYIAQNPKVAAINSAIEVDMTGQVCADSIGGKIYSGVGGQVDFLRGASLSKGGKPIIALPSITKNGESKIVPWLKQGAGVVTTRAHVHYVITEYGIAYLYGKNLNERAEALIKIAHPNHREKLTQIWKSKWWLNKIQNF